MCQPMELTDLEWDEQEKKKEQEQSQQKLPWAWQAAGRPEHLEEAAYMMP